MKKALIFDAYDDYEIRVRYIKNALERAGYDVQIFFADFDHYRKQYVEKRRPEVNYIHVQSYSKNLSYARIHSHIKFAKACEKKAESIDDVSLVYVMAPPNSMVQQFAFYKKKHPEIEYWLDICDMWPESLPVSGAVKKAASPFLHAWRMKRDGSLDKADIVSLECNLFRKPLEGKIDENRMRTLYLCQPERFVNEYPDIEKDDIGILYCGSMNHITDYELIVSFMKEMNRHRRTVLHIIGDGENREALLAQLKKMQIPYQYYGRMYDELEKVKIYAKCHFGFNVMKDSVYVGLTMKSLDYMSYGLPLLSNIQGDTFSFVSDRKIGYNLKSDGVSAAAESIIHMDRLTYGEMRSRTALIFTEYFSDKAVNKQLDQIIDELKGK
jgi:glycosyltransferase involved in cell wall biosynthesis